MDKLNKIIKLMKKRESELQRRSDKDFTGGYDSSNVGRLKEISFWIGMIEREDYDKLYWDNTDI